MKDIPQIPAEISNEAARLLKARTPSIDSVAQQIRAVVGHIISATGRDDLSDVQFRGPQVFVSIGVGLAATGRSSLKRHRAFAQIGRGDESISYEFNLRGARTRAFTPDYEIDVVGKPVQFPTSTRRIILEAIAYGNVTQLN